MGEKIMTIYQTISYMESRVATSDNPKDKEVLRHLVKLKDMANHIHEALILPFPTRNISYDLNLETQLRTRQKSMQKLLEFADKYKKES